MFWFVLKNTFLLWYKLSELPTGLTEERYMVKPFKMTVLKEI